MKLFRSIIAEAHVPHSAFSITFCKHKNDSHSNNYFYYFFLLVISMLILSVSIAYASMQNFSESIFIFRGATIIGLWFQNVQIFVISILFYTMLWPIFSFRAHEQSLNGMHWTENYFKISKKEAAQNIHLEFLKKIFNCSTLSAVE